MAKLTFFREAGNSRDSAKILQFSLDLLNVHTVWKVSQFYSDPINVAKLSD